MEPMARERPSQGTSFKFADLAPHSNYGADSNAGGIVSDSGFLGQLPDSDSDHNTQAQKFSHECHYRELDVTQPYVMYDLDSSLDDDDNNYDDNGSIAASPEGKIEKRAPAYSQWRKNGKRSQVRISEM